MRSDFLTGKCFDVENSWSVIGWALLWSMEQLLIVLTASPLTSLKTCCLCR